MARPLPQRSALRTGGWVVAARVAPQASGLLLLVLGGRYLTPETLGTFVLAFAGIEFLRHLIRAGWREATLLDETGKAVPTLLGLSLASGIAAQPLVFGAGYAAARFYAQPELGVTLAILGLSLLPIGAAAVWEGVLLRRNAPERAARPLIAAEVVQSVVAAALLVAGWGILALAIARAARAAVLALGLAAAAGWPCRVSADLQSARAVLPVSGHVTVASLAGLAGTSGADLIVGLVLGPAAVAYYRVAARIAGAVSEVVTESARVLSWSSLAGRGPVSARAVAEMFDRALVLTIPVFVGLALVARPLVETLLGQAWTDAAPALAVLALARLAGVPLVLAVPVLASHGRTKTLPRLSALLAAATLLGTLAVGHFGLLAVAFAQLAASAVGSVAVLILLRPIAPLPTLLPRAGTLVAAACFAAAVAAVGTAQPQIALILQISAGAALWTAFVLLGRPDLAGELLRGARKSDP